ncbi:MAG: NAD(P)/FAD-dependent oxidoreductase [Bdellovibrio sp.]|jgi:renalase
MSFKSTPLAIVGAGVCGLSLAEFLRREKKINSLIIEKSKSVGGRLATRRRGAGVFDHGAQFYKAPPGREPFWHKTLVEDETVRLWFTNNQDQACFSARTGMTAIAKSLAVGHEILFDHKVVRIELLGAGLKLCFESGGAVMAEKLVLTCPLPQSLALLRDSQLTYDPALDQVTYASALVGLFETLGPASWVSGFQARSGEIYSISDNGQKGISPVSALTVVMNPQFSLKNFDQPEDLILNQIQILLEDEMPAGQSVVGRGLKKWRFSHADAPLSQPFYRLPTATPIFLAGDGFGSSSVLGAVRSAEALAGCL